MNTQVAIVESGRIVRHVGAETVVPWWSFTKTLIAAAAVYLAAPLARAMVVAIDRADVASALLFAAARATGPFVPAAAVVAALLVLAVPPVLALADRPAR